jgi:ribonuclease VapC
MRDLVLDSYALIAYLEDEPGAGRIEKIFEKVKDGGCQALMSAINWGEVYYSMFCSKGEDKAEDVLIVIEQLPLEIVGVDRNTVYQASRLKAKYSVAFANCFAAALAVKRNCKVITGDKEFQKLEGEVSVEWL